MGIGHGCRDEQRIGYFCHGQHGSYSHSLSSSRSDIVHDVQCGSGASSGTRTGAKTPRRSTNGCNTEVDWASYAINARNLWAGMVWDHDLEGPTTQRCGTHKVASVPAL